MSNIKIPNLLPFSEDNLALALSNEFTEPKWIKNKKFHYKYFLEYLSTGEDCLEAKTILIEEDYISQGYLIDYAEYYASCLTSYKRTCRRIHFFSKNFDEKKLEEMLFHNNHNDIWDSYLGYIIVKPLPNAPIGATVLKTYTATKKSARFFPVTRNYRVNLFGKELAITNSLAFMEQDRIVSACATAALWSSFHKVSDLFQTALPSPIEITKSAKSDFSDFGRILPNDEGLDTNQICKAIDSIGLVSELRNSGKITIKNLEKSEVHNITKATVYSYLCLGLPIMLGIRFSDSEERHLITLTGYQNEKPNYGFKEKITLWSDKITKFYAHDDGSGPFSRLKFLDDKKLETAWRDKDGALKQAEIDNIIIPVHSKIRITFEDVYRLIHQLDICLYSIFKAKKKKTELIWDIRLQFSNDYKKEVRESEVYEEYIRKKILTSNMPKYIWRAVAITDIGHIIELVFDATAINTANDYCLVINIFDYESIDFLQEQTDALENINLELGTHFSNLLKEEIQIKRAAI